MSTTVADHLDLLAAPGVPGILVTGTIGDFASLTVSERKHVLELCRGRWSRRLIAKVGSRHRIERLRP